MEQNPIVTNPNDFKVVEFFNHTDFDFTSELGAMYDGRPLFVGSGEKRQYPYHIGHRLAMNLAKAVLVKGAPVHNPNDNNPVGKPLWNDEGVQKLADSFITELYSEDKPIIQSETDRLMAKVAELEKMMNERLASSSVPATAITPRVDEKSYVDKAEVIAELEVRGIKFDRRSSKENLVKLLKV
jgi:hypothetical protein